MIFLVVALMVADLSAHERAVCSGELAALERYEKASIEEAPTIRDARLKTYNRLLQRCLSKARAGLEKQRQQDPWSTNSESSPKTTDSDEPDVAAAPIPAKRSPLNHAQAVADDPWAGDDSPAPTPPTLREPPAPTPASPTEVAPVTDAKGSEAHQVRRSVKVDRQGQQRESARRETKRATEEEVAATARHGLVDEPKVDINQPHNVADTSGAAWILALLLVATLVVGSLAVVGLWKRLNDSRARLAEFAPIRDANAHLLELEAKGRDAQEKLLANEAEWASAQIAIQSRREHAERQVSDAEARLRDLDSRLALHDAGFYEPRFNFGSALEYKQVLDKLEVKQASMMKDGAAASCSKEWEVNGSKSEGRKVTDKVLRLMLRAFNGECNALIAKVKYDNRALYRDRIRNSFEAINRFGAGFHCSISSAYLDSKTMELDLTHEYQEQLQAEREEQRRIREEMREEERRERELAKAQKDAEDDEARYAKALERARAEAAITEGAKQAELRLQISELEVSLREAHEKSVRAKSQAQLTRAGHVYVLSNIGSFGDNVFKVGMTRRLDPNERVYELGDASVPFPFDVHAMIYTDDAPALEKALHQLFDVKRLNKINNRKEFFRTTIEEIETVVRKHHGEFKLTRHAEAIEYRRTIALLTSAGPGIPIGSAAAIVTNPNDPEPASN
jgi:Domain of unknown function (DUF4041)/Meiotically up-regulated gene 113